MNRQNHKRRPTRKPDLLNGTFLTCWECRIDSPKKAQSGVEWLHSNGLVCRSGRFHDLLVAHESKER